LSILVCSRATAMPTKSYNKDHSKCFYKYISITIIVHSLIPYSKTKEGIHDVWMDITLL
jgi:hypothetical protein